MAKNVSIIGASGYTGGELLRLLIPHSEVEIKQVTSERFAKKPLSRVHPHLRHSDLKFCSIEDLESCDILFTCLPHGQLMHRLEEFKSKAEHVIDLSADFRLNDAETFQKWYEEEHTAPDALQDFVYGNVELHRDQMKGAKYIAGVGCNATTTIFALYPLLKAGVVDLNMPITAEAKVGSCEAGNKASSGSHHPERKGTVRSFAPVRHRHIAEMEQELALEGTKVHFSATAIELVRGVMVTGHLFLKDDLDEKDLWKIYRETYGGEPFIRIIKGRTGNFRFPDPKVLTGTNFCDVSFVKDPRSKRVVVMAALDNLMKGASGMAVQAMNVMMGWDEILGLEFKGLHPC